MSLRRLWVGPKERLPSITEPLRVGCAKDAEEGARPTRGGAGAVGRRGAGTAIVCVPRACSSQVVDGTPQVLSPNDGALEQRGVARAGKGMPSQMPSSSAQWPASRTWKLGTGTFVGGRTHRSRAKFSLGLMRSELTRTSIPGDEKRSRSRRLGRREAACRFCQMPPLISGV